MVAVSGIVPLARASTARRPSPSPSKPVAHPDLAKGLDAAHDPFSNATSDFASFLGSISRKAEIASCCRARACAVCWRIGVEKPSMGKDARSRSSRRPIELRRDKRSVGGIGEETTAGSKVENGSAGVDG